MIRLLSIIIFTFGCGSTTATPSQQSGTNVPTAADEHLECTPIPSPHVNKKPSGAVAMILVIDKSRSVGTQDKLGIFRELAFPAASQLQQGDYFGIIAFDHSPFEIVRLNTVRVNAPLVQKRIKNLIAAGSTHLSPTLHLAASRLRAVSAGSKHVVILSDTMIRDLPAELLPLIEKFRTDKIIPTVLAFGPTAKGYLLEEFADCTGGKYLQTFQRDKLEAHMLQEIRAFR